MRVPQPRMPARRSAWSAVALATVAVALLATGCGDDTDDESVSVDRQDLIGVWQIDSYVTADGRVPPLEGSEPTLTFTEDDEVQVVTGCNNAVGSWTLDGDALTVTQLAQTMRACEDPEGIMDQEMALTAAVQSAARVELDGDILRLIDADGQVTLESSAAS